MTFAQIQADAEAHLAAIRAAENIGPEHVEKTTQLVCVLASELAARSSVFDARSGLLIGEVSAVSGEKAPRADRKRKPRG